MSTTIIEQLAEFSADTNYAELPAEVVEDTKLIILDSIGCALASTEQPKGKAGIDYGRLTGGGTGPATIIGTGDKVSVFGPPSRTANSSIRSTWTRSFRQAMFAHMSCPVHLRWPSRSGRTVKR